MKLHYYPETDSLYVEFKSGPGTETREVTTGLNVDLDANGDIVGFDIAKTQDWQHTPITILEEEQQMSP